jgi:hypothetical protein
MPLQQSSLWKLASRFVAAALCNFLWTQGSFVINRYLYYGTWILVIILLLYVLFEHPGHTYRGFVPSFSEWGMTTAQGSHAEEQQQPKDQDIEDEANEEYPPPSDTEEEKMYRNADEVESFGSELQFLSAGFKLCWST